MANYVETLLHKWGDNESSELRLRISNLERWLYWSYEPNKFGEHEFERRLEDWLRNVATDEDKKLLLRLLVELFYVGPDEFDELYRAAYQGPIARWIADKISLDVCRPGAQTELHRAAQQTWFCPVTDSFRVNAFFHINNLPPGGSLRPDWRSLLRLGDPAKIDQYCKSEGIERLVLLEDFVGGGSQSVKAVQFAASALTSVSVLFVPLLICPAGVKAFQDLEASLNIKQPNKLRYEAVVELPPSAFLNDQDSPFDVTDPHTTKFRDLALRTYPQVSGGLPAGNNKPYHPFGYPPPPMKPTGGLVVMYSNTPDNTLPLVHWRPTAKTWSPIFPRHSRD